MNHLEKTHVYNVYSHICHEFDTSRQYQWKIVSDFISLIPSGSLVCDIGSGNGKNITRNDIHFVASDLSYEMCNLSCRKTPDVVQSNVLKLPFVDGLFDFVMCIACVHHLSSPERRKSAISECFRLLKLNGKMIISCWAESSKYGSGDQLIKWNTCHIPRYYHMFHETSFRELFDHLSYSSIDIIYYKFNYYAVVSK